MQCGSSSTRCHQTALFRQHKVTLIEILKADAEFVLQHAHSRRLLSERGYQEVKHCHTPIKKVTELLDHIIQRGPEAAQGLLDLLREPDLQETFPSLENFVKELHINTVSSDIIPTKKICSSGESVTEKQLMAVARAFGKSWRAIGRQTLDIPSVKLEQIEEDNSLHVERVFAMLRYWRKVQREKATAAHLHSLLSQGDEALPAESIDFLLETD
uniref:Zgc:174906 n=1 Tax=Kryptolebias marmoratus TaxID=37003 RepID=A0A3Q3BD94_KRYMA